MCCSVLQCVAVCCSVLQCVAVCCSVLQCVAVCCNVLQCAGVCCSVLQCVAVCCSVLQCVAVNLTLQYRVGGGCVTSECFQNGLYYNYYRDSKFSLDSFIVKKFVSVK